MSKPGKHIHLFVRTTNSKQKLDDMARKKQRHAGILNRQ